MALFRFRYSLRTLFVVVTLLAIPCCWVGWQYRIVAERMAMLAEIEAAGGRVTIVAVNVPAKYYVTNNLLHEPEPLPWYRHALGDREIFSTFLPPSMPDRTGTIQEVFPEANIARAGALQHARD